MTTFDPALDPVLEHAKAHAACATCRLLEEAASLPGALPDQTIPCITPHCPGARI